MSSHLFPLFSLPHLITSKMSHHITLSSSNAPTLKRQQTFYINTAIFRFVYLYVLTLALRHVSGSMQTELHSTSNEY